MKASVFVRKSVLSVVAVVLTACGGTQSTITPPPASPVANISVAPTSGAASANVTITYSCTNATSATASGGWSDALSLSGMVTKTPSATTTYTLTCTGTGGTATASATYTVVAPPSPTVTGVSLPCTPTTFDNVQTTSCTPAVSGTGTFTNTVNLSVSPASAGTLSATTNVASGTAVVFTPTFNTGAQTPMIKACSAMAGYTNVCSSTTLTVTLRTITINSPTGNIWLADCGGIVNYSSTEMGIVSGDALYVYLYAANTFTTAPVSTFAIGLPIGNNPGGLNACSPGAYDEYVLGTDGAKSNDVYIPILSPWNTWAGYNSTDEFQADYAHQMVYPYKLTDGSSDGPGVPIAGLANAVDGNNLISGRLGNTGIGVYNITTGAYTLDIGPTDGSSIVDFAAKNSIVGYSTTTPEVGFSMEAINNSATAISNVGTAPSAIVGSIGCNANPNSASFFSYDNAGSTLYRSDVVGNVSTGTITSATRIGGVSLSGFSPASALPNNLARYVVAWDGTCKAAVLAPVTTGGTNPDGTTAYVMEFALVDMTSGNMHQIGTYVSTGIPSTAIRIAADPSGNDVVIASTNQATGTTLLTKISWTLDVNENPTFTLTPLVSAPPVGIYGVSLGILPSSAVPNGTVIRVGQRQQHYALPNQ